jgi:hypothetical protein
MIKYKILNKNMESYNGHKWYLGVKQTITKPGIELCTDQVFHYYDSPEEAVLFNPIHANIINPKLFEAEIDAEINNDGLIGGSKEMMLVNEIMFPQITIDKIVSFAIHCALQVYNEKYFVEWAKNWLNEKDHSACAAAALAIAAARAALVTITKSRDDARAAARDAVAYFAALATDAALAADAARAIDAARAAARAAVAAARAALAAALAAARAAAFAIDAARDAVAAARAAKKLINLALVKSGIQKGTN